MGNLSPILAPRVLIEGPGGTGKTTALKTLVAAGITPCVIALDNAGMEVLGDVPCPKLHWHMIKPGKKTWSSMAADMKTWANLDHEGLTKLRDTNKHLQTRFVETLSTLASFTCDRCGEKLGEVDTWPTSRAIVIDHLTELGQAAKEWTVGEKPLMHMGEWQAAQNVTENLLRQLVTVPRCWVIVIAHVDRELDEVQGGTKVMTATLGKKLAPRLPPLFSDVILAERQVKDFWWSTAAVGVDLKTRNLEIATKLEPSFKLIVERWKARGGIIE